MLRGDPRHVDGQHHHRGGLPEQGAQAGQQSRGRTAVRRVLTDEGRRQVSRDRITHDHDLDGVDHGIEGMLEQRAATELDAGLVRAAHPGGRAAGEDDRGELRGGLRGGLRFRTGGWTRWAVFHPRGRVGECTSR